MQLRMRKSSTPRKLTERHDRGDPLPGVVILCDCRSLVQNLGGFNPTSMGDILSATEHLRQADVRIICQWIPSHVGIHGNEVADELANADRLQPQPTVPATLAHVSSLLRGKRRKGGERRSKGMMTQGWLSFMRLDELMIIALTSREVTPYKYFACA